MMIRDADLTPLDIDGRLWLRGALDDAALEALAAAVVDRLGDDLRRLVADLLPEVAERVVRERIRELEQDPQDPQETERGASHGDG